MTSNFIDSTFFKYLSNICKYNITDFLLHIWDMIFDRETYFSKFQIFYSEPNDHNCKIFKSLLKKFIIDLLDLKYPIDKSVIIQSGDVVYYTGRQYSYPRKNIFKSLPGRQNKDLITRQLSSNDLKPSNSILKIYDEISQEYFDSIIFEGLIKSTIYVDPGIKSLPSDKAKRASCENFENFHPERKWIFTTDTNIVKMSRIHKCGNFYNMVTISDKDISLIENEIYNHIFICDALNYFSLIFEINSKLA